jgi:hypothetical protein
MASSTDYLPSRESELVTFSTNFNAKIVATPTAYGLTAAQATAYTALHTAFTSAYQTANNPDTRSPSNITAKNTAKENLINGTPGSEGIRELAAIAQAYPAITAEQLRELGLTVRDREPSPIPVPTVSPEIDFIPTGTRTIRIRMHNENSLRLKKPDGVKGATVFYHVGAAAPAELKDWTFHESTTRTSLDVDLPASVAAGSQVWFTAFWFNPRSQSGPAATPVSTFMQYGGLAAAA